MRDRNQYLLELLREWRVEDALACLDAGQQTEPWLAELIRFLAKRTWEGRHYGPPPADQCLNETGRGEILAVLRGIFEHPRDGAVLAAAVELAEALGSFGVAEAGALAADFFAKGRLVERRMVKVPAGHFLFGEKGKAKTIPCEAFEIDLFPVTNAEYRKMVPGHLSRDERLNGDDQPVVMVNWYEAELYSRWREGRLPTEQQWEKAASWDERIEEKREYPWGDWDRESSHRCNTAERKLQRATSVGDHPDGRSPYGCYDMAGNVWEWTASYFDSGRQTLVLRGGSWSGDLSLARCAYRNLSDPEFRYDIIGFRCVRT